ncbi:MAG TPA: hypothetical protein VJQ82_06795 [Terriglobales bacterium]|nr:hypothetical protein [Terriglobales bacterium]
MVNPVINKTVQPFNTTATEGSASPAKVGESKFDKVRARQLDDQASRVDLPPEVKSVSPDQKARLALDLAKQLQNSNTLPVHELFAPKLQQAKLGVQNLAKRVNALPKTQAFDPLRQRLASIDSQYQAAGKLVNSLQGAKNPGDLMKIQMQMYQLTENLELMSKVVEQVSSGVKSVLQTQL